MDILKKLYEEDVAEKWGVNRNTITDEEREKIDKNDRKRREKVLKLYKEKAIQTGQDYHHASLIMQHGETVDDYKLAHEFASKAVNLGNNNAKWLFAATLDRYLLTSGKPQKYGTQFKQNEKGEWEMAQPIDPKVTDEERAKYNVPPLKDALKKYKEKYNLK